MMNTDHPPVDHAKGGLSGVLHLMFGIGLITACSAPDLSPEVKRLIVVVGTASWLFCGRADLRRRAVLSVGGGTLLLVAGFGVLLIDRPIPLLVSIVLGVVATTRILRGAPLVARRVLPVAGVLVVLAHVLFSGGEYYDTLRMQGLLAWSGTIGELVGAPLRVGPSVQGFPYLYGAFAVVVARFGFLERRWLRLSVSLLVMIILHAVAVSAYGWFPPETLSHDALRVLGGLLGATFTLAAVAWAGRGRLRIRSGCGPMLRLVPLQWAAAALLAAALLSPLVVEVERPRVVLYSANEGPFLRWDRAEYGRHGKYSQGMFGQLPDYLEADGFEVSIERERIRAEHLVGVDLLVTFNLDLDWEPNELRTIWDFVERGGRLLLAGDHTGMRGSRRVQNELLAPVGIEFNFDSTVSSARRWSDIETYFHQINATSASSKTNISVGASLSIGPSSVSGEQVALPLIVSRYTLADLGDVNNAARAYLGDYRYQPGEQAGDVILAAWAPLGDGVVAVFGDTSSFQNAALTDSYPYVRRLFHWLCGDPIFSLGGWDRWGLLLAVGCAGLALFLRPTRTTLIASGLMSVLIVTESVPRVQADLLSRPRLQGPVAYLDFSHSPRIDLASRGKNSLGGLIQNLDRAGYLTQAIDRLDERVLRPDCILFSLAPVRAYSDAEVETLRDFMAEGGLVVAACGFDHRNGLDPLLRTFDLDISSDVIGPVPLSRKEGRVRRRVEYIEAWPICRRQSATDSESRGSHPSEDGGVVLAANQRRNVDNLEVLDRFRQVPLAVVVRHGDGGLVVVGDTYFFSSQNLEYREEVSVPNLEFLRNLIRRFRSWKEQS